MALSIADIDHDIEIIQNLLSLYPRFHSEYITCVNNLGWARWTRYQLSQEKVDLDKSIIHCTEAIFLPPVSEAEHSDDVVRLLFHLARALILRFEEFQQSEGVKCSVEFLRYLRLGGIQLDSFEAPRSHVTTLLIRALGVQVMSEAGDGTRNIEEMVDLCRELLTSTEPTLSAGILNTVFRSLSFAVDTESFRGRVQSVDQVVACLRDASKMCPPDSLVFYVLARTLHTRFMVTHSNDDYEEVRALLKRFLDPNIPEEDPMRQLASTLATQLAHSRSIIFRNPQYTEESIYHLRTSLHSPFIDEILRIQFTRALAGEVRERSVYYGLAESLEEANSYTSQLVDLSSSQCLENFGELSFLSGADRESYSVTRITRTIQHLKERLSITPPGTDSHNYCLCHLAEWYESKFNRTNISKMTRN